MRDLNLGLNDPGQAITRQDANVAGGYAGLDDDCLLDNRQLRRTNGYIFDADTKYITCVDTDNVTYINGDFAIEAAFCILTFGAGDSYVYSKGDSTNNLKLYINTSGLIRLGITIDGVVTFFSIGDGILANTDYHLIVSKLGDKIYTYVNSDMISRIDFTYQLKIGFGSPQSRFYVSKLYFLRQYNRGFSQSDVDYYYNNGQPDKARLMYSDTNINTAELVAGGDFEGGLIGSKVDSDGSVSNWALNTVSPISGAQDGRLVITTGAPISDSLPHLTFPMNLKSGLKYRVSFKYKLNAGSIDDKIKVYNGASGLPISQLSDYTKTIDTISFNILMVNDYALRLYFESRDNNLIDIQIDNLSVKEVGCVLELLPENATPAKWLGTQQVIDGITSGSPSINYGNFYKKEEVIEPFHKYIGLSQNGDGTGTSKFSIKTNKSGMCKIYGGEFRDSKNEKSLGTEINVYKNTYTDVYVKLDSLFGEMVIDNLVHIQGYGGRGANDPAPFVSASELPMIALLSGEGAGGNANKIYGEVSSIPRDVLQLSISASRTFNGVVKGDFLNLPRGLKHLYLNESGIVGDVKFLPRNISSLNCFNSSMVSGFFRDIPQSCESIGLSGAITLSGDISDFRGKIQSLTLYSSTVIYSGGKQIFKEGVDTITLRPNPGVLTSAMIDQLLIDLGGQVQKAIGNRTIDLRGNCAARTSASDAAVAYLQGIGFSVYTN